MPSPHDRPDATRAARGADSSVASGGGATRRAAAVGRRRRGAAVELRHTWGQYYFVWLCQTGQGGPPDPLTARAWFARAVPGLEKLDADGDSGAQNCLGHMYLNGYGVAQDYVKARPLFERAADGDSHVAWLNLGHLYHYGYGVEQDFAKAADLYRKAGGRGEPIAQYRLGALYESGDGVEKDRARAREWYKRAAAQGNRDARQALERLDEK